MTENPLSSDTDFQSTLPESESESNIDTKVATCQEIREDQDELATEKLESLESSDNEEMLFWTQAATELEHCDDGDDPAQRHDNEKSGKSAEKNSTFVLNHAWDTDADDFIDQLLITGAEGETISSSPDSLPDTCTSDPPKKPGTTSSLPSISFGMQSKPPVCIVSTKSVPSTSQATVGTVATTDACTTGSDRCPTPPLPLPLTRQSPLSKPQPHDVVRLALRKSPRKRPPSWRLALEDARSTPPLSPLTGEVCLDKALPLQDIGAHSSRTGLAEVSREQGLYGKDDNLRTSGVVNVCKNVTGPSTEMVSYHTGNQSESARRSAVYIRGNVQSTSTVHNPRPVSTATDSHGQSQNADSAVPSTSVASFSRSYNPATRISRQVLDTRAECQTHNGVGDKNLSSKESAGILLHQGNTGNYQIPASVGTDQRSLAKLPLQSTTSCDVQHSKISPSSYKSTMISSNATQHQVRGSSLTAPVISTHPATSSATANVHQCSQAEIERKRNLARSKLQAKKKTSFRYCHHN